MKAHWTFTYVVNKTRSDGTVEPDFATYQEWHDIAMRNKGLPKEQRRWFIRLYDLQGNEMSCMFIEAPYDYYLAWHKEHEAYMRNRRAERTYRFVSMDAHPFEDSEKDYTDLFGTTEDELEERTLSNITMANLTDDLSGWKPWAGDLMTAYLSGKKRTCTKPLAVKYGMSDRAMRSNKRKFERYAAAFLADNG